MKRSFDMTSGSILPAMLLFAIPTLIGNLLQQVYSMTDSIIVGRVLGLDALAAVGGTMPIIFLIASLIFGINGGVIVALSQAFGRKDLSSMRRSFANSLYLGLLIAGIMAVLGSFLPLPVLRLIGTPEELLPDAVAYIRVNFFTAFCPMLYYLFFCAFRGMGDSTASLYCLVVSVITNIALDYLFVARLGWGVAGSAWATALAQLLAVAVSALLLFAKYPVMRFQKGDLRPDAGILRSIARLALPIALQSAFNNLGNIIAQRAVNIFGAVIMGAYTAASRIGAFALMPLETVGSTLAVYTGQNYGAENKDRIQKGVRAAVRLQAFCSTAAAFILILFGRQIASAFLEEAPEEMLRVSYSYLLIAAVPGIIAGLMFVFQQALQGMGKARDSMIGGFILLGTKSIVVLIGAIGFKTTNALWAAWPLSFAAGAAFVYRRWRIEIEKLSFREI